MATLLVQGGYLLDPSLPFQQSDVLIENQVIARVDTSIEGGGVDRVIDASDKVVLPGLVSGHSHVTTTLDKALVDNLPLDPWMIYTVYGSIPMSPRDLYVCAALGAVEMLKKGCTSFVDHTPVDPSRFDDQIDAVAQAFVDVGARAVVAPLYTDMDFSKTLPLFLLEGVKQEDTAVLDVWPVPEAHEITEMVRRFLRRWQGRHPRITPCLGPSGPQRCSMELLGLTVEMAREFQVNIHTHLLETKGQALIGNRMFPPSMVGYLRDIGFLGPGTSLAHCVWLSDQDIQVLAETGSNVVHNPISNTKMGSGIAPVQALKAHGVNVALGVDGPGDGDTNNIFEVMKCAGMIHKLYGYPETWIGAGDVFDMCLIGGSRSLQKKVGLLEPGYYGDLVIMEPGDLALLPKKNAINQLVYGELGSSVETVIVGGQVIVDQKEIKTVDEKALRSEARDIIRRMYSTIDSRNRYFEAGRGLMERMVRAVTDFPLPFNRYAGIN